MHILKSLKNSIIINYANFEGRVTRRDYILFTIIYDVIGSIFLIYNRKFGDNYIIIILGIAFVVSFLIPHLSINIRRLHDISLSGWWYLLAGFIPFGLIIISIALMLYPGTPGPNKYGDPPVDQF